MQRTEIWLHIFTVHYVCFAIVINIVVNINLHLQYHHSITMKSGIIEVASGISPVLCMVCG
jgi:hypothetical protein